MNEVDSDDVVGKYSELLAKVAPSLRGEFAKRLPDFLRDDGVQSLIAVHVSSGVTAEKAEAKVVRSYLGLEG